MTTVVCRNNREVVRSSVGGGDSRISPRKRDPIRPGGKYDARRDEPRNRPNDYRSNQRRDERYSNSR